MDRKRRIVAVLDTNVLLGIDGRNLLFAVEDGLFDLVWSDYIEAEVRRIMQRMRWGEKNGAMLLSLIDELAERVDHRVVTGGNYEEWLKDVDDHPIMATAIMAKADFLVTNNTKDFPPKKRFAGITIITSEAFQDWLDR